MAMSEPATRSWTVLEARISGVGRGHHRRRDTPDIAIAQLDLAGMQPHPDLQVEEVSGQHQLDRSVVAVQVLQQQGELRGRLEDVAACRPPMWVSDRNTSSVSSGSRSRMTPSSAPSLITLPADPPRSRSWSRSRS